MNYALFAASNASELNITATLLTKLAVATIASSMVTRSLKLSNIEPDKYLDG